MGDTVSGSFELASSFPLGNTSLKSTSPGPTGHRREASRMARVTLRQRGLRMMTEARIRRILQKRTPDRSGKVPGPAVGIRQVKVTRQQRKAVGRKTGGACHVCGGKVDKQWQVDHVIPYSRGGASRESNYLPACSECNRLRWGYRPEVIRLMIRFGRLAKQEIRHGRPVGDVLIKLALRSRG